MSQKPSRLNDFHPTGCWLTMMSEGSLALLVVRLLTRISTFVWGREKLHRWDDKIYCSVELDCSHPLQTRDKPGPQE